MLVLYHRGGVGGGGTYQYGYGRRATSEVEQLRAEVTRMQQDRMNDMIRQLDEKWGRRLTELRREMGTGAEHEQEGTITIADEKGNPMVVP